MTCERCGAPVTPKDPSAPGYQARFCSENCRKRACDERNRATCAGCGADMGPRSGWKDRNRPRLHCLSCENDRRRAIHDARVERAAALYNAGKSHQEIAEAFGYGENSTPGVLIRDARRRGLIGYRNRGYANRQAA